MNLNTHIPPYSYNRFSDDGYGNYAGGHRGIDIMWSGISGTTIRAVKSGTISFAQAWDGVTTSGTSNQTWGHCVKINHQDGTSTLYAHMQSAPAFTVGDSVTQGQQIGTVGSTGYSTTPHLHFEVYVGTALKNPITYLTGAPSYAGSHTHTYRFVWYEGTHPHQNYEQCTSCGELRGMGTYAASYTNTYYENAHPHKCYGTCKICATGHYTGETAACKQVALYYEKAHPHPKVRVLACGATELTGTYEPCNQVALYYEKAHPHPKVRVFACGDTELTGTYEPCSQVGLYYEKEHPHKRIRELACGATEFTGTYEPCRQVGLYYEKEHPHQRVRELACGAKEYLDSYDVCTCS